MPKNEDAYTPFDGLDDPIELPPKPILVGSNKHPLVRMYDSANNLLYITKSVQLQKLSNKNWFNQVSTIKVEWFPSPGAAEDGKIMAMEHESPKHNQRRAFS